MNQFLDEAKKNNTGECYPLSVNRCGQGWVLSAPEKRGEAEGFFRTEMLSCRGCRARCGLLFSGSGGGECNVRRPTPNTQCPIECQAHNVQRL